MAYRIVQIFTDIDPRERLDKLRDDGDILDYWEIATKKSRTFYNVLCKTDDTQTLTDKLQPLVSSEDKPHIAVLPVLTVLPMVQNEEEDEDKKQVKKKVKGISREELYETRCWHKARSGLSSTCDLFHNCCRNWPFGR